MSKINLILSREFTERVRKKSFIITTLLTPILMITLMAAPTLIMMLGKTSTKKVVVVDNSPDRFVGRQLKSGSTVEFRLLDTGITAAEARAQYSNADRAYGILIIGSDILSNPGNLQLILNDASSMSVEESINGQIRIFYVLNA